MRCRSCDEVLNDFEATRISIDTSEYVDLCSKCYSSIEDNISTFDRMDLKHMSDERIKFDDDLEMDYYEDYIFDNHQDEDY